jgi:transposase InsO family protein
VKRLETMLEAQRCGKPRSLRERRRAQALRREAERVGSVVPPFGLGLPARTINDWTRRREAGLARRTPRGRPRRVPTRAQRQDVLAILSVMGPRVSLATLRALFSDIPRAVLEDLRTRYREVYRRRNCWVIRALRWTRAGAVWALDFATPPRRIDGTYARLLLVRDLASGRQLVALPCRDETTNTVRAVLEALFLRFGVPLVLKSDNGSAFREKWLKDLVRRKKILWLYSPPAMPRYNGACEAGVGSIKTRAHFEAARHDRPGDWTCDDVEAARLQANEMGRPRGHRGPTPDEAWYWRKRVTDEEREAFLAAYRTYELEERRERGIDPHATLDHYGHASIDRVAIGRALIQNQLLCVRRRRIPLRVSPSKTANIT